MHEAGVHFNGIVTPHTQFFFTDFSQVNGGLTRWASLAGESFGTPLVRHQSMAVFAGVVTSLSICMITAIPDNTLELSAQSDGISHPSVLVVGPGLVGYKRVDISIPMTLSTLINLQVINNASSGQAEFVAGCGIRWA